MILTCGERDENGFADTYVNGKKTNVRMLLFDKERREIYMFSQRKHRSL